MSNRIAIYEGYSTPFAGYKKKRKGGKMAQRAKFKKAAKACKGKSLRAFRACMRAKLKK
jgi:hypothetical protein